SRARLRAITELERMQERLRAIEDLRPALTGAHDSVGLLTAAAEAIAERFGAQATSVMLIEPNGEMRIAASVGLEPQVAKEARRRVGEGISGWVAERGRGVLLRGPIEDARFRGVDPEARVALSVPLRLGSAVLGVVNVKRPREGTTFDESHLRALEAIASDVATALKQVEQLQGLEEDRRRAGEHIRVFVLDDHPIVREGLRRVLELDGDIGVCGAAQTLSEALLALPEARPGVIVCDLHLPDADDVEAVRRLSGRGIPLIVF